MKHTILLLLAVLLLPLAALAQTPAQIDSLSTFKANLDRIGTLSSVAALRIKKNKSYAKKLPASYDIEVDIDTLKTVFERFMKKKQTLPNCFAAEYELTTHYIEALTLLSQKGISNSTLLAILTDIMNDLHLKAESYHGGWKNADLISVQVHSHSKDRAETKKYIEYIPKILEFSPNPSPSRTNELTATTVRVAPGRYLVWSAGESEDSQGKRQVMTVSKDGSKTWEIETPK